MIRASAPLTGLALTAALSLPASAGVEKVIELSAVPAAVMNVAKAKLEKVEFVSANTETEDDGSMVYVIQGRLEDGRKVEFDILPNGDIEEIEVEFSVDLVPGAVLKAIESKLPGFKPDFIEASHSRSMKVTGYEFVGMMGDKKLDIEVSADGRRVVVADQ